MEQAKIKLTSPITIGAAEVDTIYVRQRLSMGALAAVQRYARRNGLKGDVDELLEGGDIGAILALVEHLCQLPQGILDQLHPDDFSTVIEAASPFLGDSLVTGKPPSA